MTNTEKVSLRGSEFLFQRAASATLELPTAALKWDVSKIFDPEDETKLNPIKYKPMPGNYVLLRGHLGSLIRRLEKARGVFSGKRGKYEFFRGDFDDMLSKLRSQDSQCLLRLHEPPAQLAPEDFARHLRTIRDILFKTDGSGVISAMIKEKNLSLRVEAFHFYKPNDLHHLHLRLLLKNELFQPLIIALLARRDDRAQKLKILQNDFCSVLGDVDSSPLKMLHAELSSALDYLPERPLNEERLAKSFLGKGIKHCSSSGKKNVQFFSAFEKRPAPSSWMALPREDHGAPFIVLSGLCLLFLLSCAAYLKRRSRGV
ncbi:unnamed protein product [Amoebophrya sp. A25]|nr:unnamed protein product [Amoebophrya sp. A25]|eukprot:GSA25T00007120001.1